jgi:translation initiation factor IF-1
MAKQDIITLQGTIVEALSNAFFKVDVKELGKTILSQASGKIRLNRIRLVEGDSVEVELSPYDLERGRISRRL